MTYIRRLEMRGFKSSGPRPVVVAFEKGFTVITGPNGSGKSNIADAIMFAIGENSPKQLRASNGKLSGLIYDPHKEGVPAQKPNSCKVTLQLDNSDRAIPVDSDLVTVSRELRDDGENAYYLNGKKTTRGSLTEILDLAGLSAGGLNIVPQGAATKVADLTPEEKRRMVEDVVGIAKFDERKAEAQKQLSQADQRLEVALARIGEMKSTLESFDSQRNDMIRFNLLESQINWLTAVKTARRVNELRGRLSSVRAQEQELNARLAELSNRHTDFEGRISQVESEKTKFIVEVIQGGGASNVEMQFQLAELKNELDGLEADLKVAEGNVRDLEAETIPQLKAVVSAKQKEANAGKATVKQLTAEVERLDARHQDLKVRFEDFFKAADMLRDTIDKKGKQMARANTRIAELNAKLGEAEREVNAASASLGPERARMDELKQRVDNTSGVMQSIEQNTKRLLEVHEGSNKELGSIEEGISGKEGARERLLASIEQASATLEKAMAEVAKEQAFRQVSESLAGERLGQAKLQELCDSGGVPGYVGRLGQLVKYPQSYSRSVNAVMGRWLGAFVVDDLHSMTLLIRAAKTLKAKTFSVIPLSEVEGCEAVEVPKSPGVVGALSSVLKCDERFAGLANFLAGDTVLVETEATGYMTASEGLKAVTVDGETFEAGGKAFAFGYQEILMNLVEGLVNIEGISEIEDAVGALKGAISRRRSELQAIEAESRALARERLKKTVNASSLKAEATTYTRMVNRYRVLFRGMNAEYLKQTKVVERLEARQKAFSEKRESIATGAAALQNEVAEVQALGLDTMLAELEISKQSLTSDIESLRNRISELNFNLSREKANLENILLRGLEENETDLANALEDLNANNDFLRETPKRIKELTEQKQSMEQQIQKVVDSSKKSQPILDEFDSKVKRLREERDSLSRSIGSMQKEGFSLASQAESTQERIEESLGSLRMLGYNEEPEVFESSDQLLSQLEGEYNQVVSSVNRGADRQYTDMYLSYKSLSVRHNELEKERNAIIIFIESVESEKRKVFMAAFDKISSEFSAIFNRLTDGEARLELEKPDEIFTGGVTLVARFGTKGEFESLSLSGGEKAVSGVSLILAMQAVQPHPFYMFDEIDAALDAVNSGNLAHFLRERSSLAQIVGITLRDVFVSQSDITYGVYNAGGISRIVHYKPAEVPASSG